MVTGARPLVLVVDHRDWIGSATARLRPIGADVLVCHREDQALELLARSPADVVLFTQDLPGAVGLLEALRSEYPGVARYVCVDTMGLDVARNALELGAIDGCVVWPCTERLLATVLRGGLALSRTGRLAGGSWSSGRVEGPVVHAMAC